MDWITDPIGSIGDAIGGAIGGGDIGGLPDDYNPAKQLEKLIDPIVKAILSPIQSIIDDIVGFFREIWEFFLAIFGFVYMGALLAFAIYATIFIILL